MISATEKACFRCRGSLWVDQEFGDITCLACGWRYVMGVIMARITRGGRPPLLPHLDDTGCEFFPSCFQCSFRDCVK